MIFSTWLLFILCTLAYSQNCSNYYNCQLELYEKLLIRTRPSVRPIELDSQIINVRVGFSFIKFVSANEEDSLITIRAHLNQTWNATVLSWNSTAYANVQHLRVPAHLVWTPKIELINPSTIVDAEANHYVNVRSDGTCELSYSTLMTIPCHFNFQDFPFDQQTCTFELGSSLYNSNEVSINRATDVIINDGTLVANGFYFISHTIESKKGYFAGYTQEYDQISIQMNIRRQPKYFLRLINWPSTMLILLTICIFLLPPLALERIIYGSILLVCQLILLCIFASHIPRSLGATWPWMGRMIVYDMFSTAMVLVFSILIRMLGDTKYFTEKPPIRLRTFIFGYLTKVVGLKRSSYATLTANRDNEYDAHDATAGDAALEPLTSVSNGSSSTGTAIEYNNLHPLIASSSTMARDIGSIKQKFNLFVHQHNVQQEWLLLAHIVNRLCFLIYLFFFSFSLAYHLFY